MRLARFTLAALAAPILLAQSATPPTGTTSPISTDRPAVTDSSVVVPQGSLQAENGIEVTWLGSNRSWDLPETLVRVGVAPTTELRLTAPDYFSGVVSGFGDTAIGVKQQLLARGFDVSLVVSLSLPTGAGAISSHGYDPFVQLPWSRSLSKNWTVAGMLSVYWPTEAGRRNTTGESTFLFDRQLTNRWDAFVEYAGDFPERGGPRHLLHIGAAFKPSPSQQIDVHLGAGLSAAAGDFLGAGYSFRLQAFHR